ncbi:hypothetical protein PoB_003017400 [Plakobranchus ocellatus]|uniref:Uncharacterized protein n=1 Tax=Plakobranchus ocellatus TaxID=259542 RepID=A0AAV4AB41_9GAST|nr:hypothetical protein PoB_003017400 [Plakobranchus ocellatus]
MMAMVDENDAHDVEDNDDNDYNGDNAVGDHGGGDYDHDNVVDDCYKGPSGMSRTRTRDRKSYADIRAVKEFTMPPRHPQIPVM